MSDHHGVKCVARELGALIRLYRKPVDSLGQQTELMSRATLEWQNGSGVLWHYIVPGKSTHNAFTESFNGLL